MENWNLQIIQNFILKEHKKTFVPTKLLNIAMSLELICVDSFFIWHLPHGGGIDQ